MLSDRLTLAQRKQFGASSEKYAEGYEQMNLFNEAEANADAETEELFEEIRPSSYKCKKRKGKKEEDLSNFETVATRSYKLEGEARYCPACGSMKRPEKEPSLIRGSIATPSLVAGIMNAKYVNGMPLARQEREFARYDLDLSTKTMANWIINCADGSRYSENRIRKGRPRTGCGYISRMNSVVPRRWYSSIMKGPVRDIIL